MKPCTEFLESRTVQGILGIALTTGVMLAGGCASSVKIGSAGEHRHDHETYHSVIRAQRFELVNEDGDTSAHFEVDEDGALGVYVYRQVGSVRFFDEHGEVIEWRP